VIPGSLALAAVALPLSALGTGLALRYLRRRQVLDLPNERSSHSLPTPRGGGLGVVPAALLVWLPLVPSAGELGPWLLVSVAGAMLLMLTSWLDDRHGLPAGPRFLAHAVIVAGTLALLPEGAEVFQGWLPLWLDRLLAGLGWLWFVNLFNFMDGIDGISGVEAGCLGFGIALVGLVAGIGELAPPAVAVAAAATGFLLWNWHPAKLFLGDVGSVPLGFLLGGLLLLLAVGGQLAAALILPAYYLADATITLVRRGLKGEKIWQAHRQHFYQRAVQGGKRHDQVALAVLAADLALIAAALLAAAGRVVEGTAAAVIVVAALLALLAKWARS